MNALSTIADAVVSEIQAGTFTPSFSISRIYCPKFDQTNTTLTLMVAGLAEKPDIHGESSFRAAVSHDYTIQVAIMKRVSAADRTSTAAVTECDALSDFREQVIDYLKSKKQLTALSDAHLMDVDNTVAYDPDMLDQKGVFYSLITLGYKLLR